MAEAPDVVWYVRPPGGGQFGPATSGVMRGWIDEGRVSADSLVWREGWRDWQEASEVFPRLAGRVPEPELAAIAGDATRASQGATGGYRPPSNGRSSARNTALIAILVLAVLILFVVFLWVLKGGPQSLRDTSAASVGNVASTLESEPARSTILP